MKILDGAELAEYIKARQIHQVRGLRQAQGIAPRLAIVVTVDNPVIATYIRLKRAYGDDILVDVVVHKVPQADVRATIEMLNADSDVHGIIIQLPLDDPSETDEIVRLVDPRKDVDGLGGPGVLDPATPMAVAWLLAGYNVTLEHKKLVIVGNGRLVGAPLSAMWRSSGYDVTVLDDTVTDLADVLHDADVIVTATGVPGLITSDMLPIGAVVVDAGTASEHGKMVGDVAAEARDRHDLTITPIRGGVGPLTVTALFDNVIRAARAIAEARDAAETSETA